MYDETPPSCDSRLLLPHILSPASHKSEKRKRKIINESLFKRKDCDGESDHTTSNFSRYVGTSWNKEEKKNFHNFIQRMKKYLSAANDSSHLSSSSSDACQKKQKLKSTGPRFLFRTRFAVKSRVTRAQILCEMGMYCAVILHTEEGRGNSTGCKIDIVNRKRN